MPLPSWLSTLIEIGSVPYIAVTSQFRKFFNLIFRFDPKIVSKLEEKIAKLETEISQIKIELSATKIGSNASEFPSLPSGFMFRGRLAIKSPDGAFYCRACFDKSGQRIMLRHGSRNTFFCTSCNETIYQNGSPYMYE